ncbi:hypothetical protein CY34DRAFT_805599 [Suillus luteus UH-Slu-Lm8-n1]|uniref:Uncharacterized protein n=1 Tax=Suillus luteus UH-Slu-Lm8-n1 TaxID=930992 RepID=A0A0D0AIZ7_9AGAM|nr:hypothetical protein CY34DRAFT_805599 [Suillus luteus UH-Slu-Lm8-n1]
MLRFLCLREKKNIPELWFNSVTVTPFILSATVNGTPYISDEAGVIFNTQDSDSGLSQGQTDV